MHIQNQDSYISHIPSYDKEVLLWPLHYEGLKEILPVLLKNFFYDIIKYRFIGRYSRMASYKKGIGTTQNQLKHECSNRATATEKI